MFKVAYVLVCLWIAWSLLLVWSLLFVLGVTHPPQAQNVGEKDQVTPHPKLVVKERNASGIVIPARVTIHPSKEHLNKAFRKYYNVNADMGRAAVGWYDVAKGVCEIHVLDIVYVKGDPNMAPWGHELTHCIYGNFHSAN